MTIKEMDRRANLYFNNEDNKPYSILEICDKLSISPKVLKEWYFLEPSPKRTLAEKIMNRIGAGWEKGEISSTLANTLIKQYDWRGQDGDSEIITINIRVIDEQED